MWYYNSRVVNDISDFPENTIGFVYKITNKLNKRIYIGRKILYSTRRVVIGKKEKQLLKTRRIYKTIKKESDWKTYTGSSLDLNNDIKKLGISNFSFEIIELACSKKLLSYLETKNQFLYHVLETNAYNGNILGKWFNKDTSCNE